MDHNESDRLQLVETIRKDHLHKGYLTHMFPAFNGTGVWVGQSTLRPDRSFSSKYLTTFLLSRAALIQGRDCIDIGCGSGVQAVALAQSGAGTVDAVDISVFALESTHRNKKLHNLGDVLSIHHADLFTFNDIRTYDIIVFNHPFYHMNSDLSDPISTAIMDNGSTLERFFKELKNHLRPSGRLIMPFSYICGHENDPKPYAFKTELRTIESLRIRDNNGSHVIYEFGL